MSDTDLLIIGAGPAGCAAAVMAASLGLRSVLVERAAQPCGSLRGIPVLDNVLGFAGGPAYAAAVEGQLGRTALCSLRLGTEVVGLEATDRQVTARLADGTALTAGHAVVATGVRPATLAETPWARADFPVRPLRGAPAAAALLVLGADRPLGTFLRAHPGHAVRLTVLHPAADEYKTHEVRPDPRVTLVPTAAARLRRAPDGRVSAAVTTTSGEELTLTADAAVLNAGSRPAALPGLRPGPDGYCPPELQHPRVTVAGDLRSARAQRIATATGTGAQAALDAYYAGI
ncbi:FAD-dependent oxidoreductase [Kitasatospora viridis]|uniref:Thioredoxin reductase (NADPH)/alkyl hydroperoxide reductase subunit F n=1 Tax=Kitasatospora viridis TaxID=281105 RepID=A0A561S942_9ACTN|nr:FAD-dependent oxidoreductase [Kitasatospora viridis]TWF71392.1 thioredoxin reductase (NADPH)/alkyl hydroperoxide reductase subunit F [Kitasatospora viridis]